MRLEVWGEEQESAHCTGPCPEQAQGPGPQGRALHPGLEPSPAKVLTQILPEGVQRGEGEQGEGPRQAEGLPEPLPRTHRGEGCSHACSEFHQQNQEPELTKPRAPEDAARLPGPQPPTLSPLGL